MESGDRLTTTKATSKLIRKIQMVIMYNVYSIDIDLSIRRSAADSLSFIRGAPSPLIESAIVWPICDLL